MIMKILGGILVVSSCTFTGYILSEKNKYRLEDIEEMKKAISFYKGSVYSMGLSVEEAFKETSTRIKGAVKSIFAEAASMAAKRTTLSVQQIWNNAVKNNIDSSFLEKEEIESIYSFGSVLGFMDRQQHNENAQLIINELENVEKNVRQKSVKDEKMFLSMGVLCGLLFCILLF